MLKWAVIIPITGLLVTSVSVCSGWLYRLVLLAKPVLWVLQPNPLVFCLFLPKMRYSIVNKKWELVLMNLFEW